MNINPPILGLTLDTKLTYIIYRKHNNKSTQDNTDTQSTHINNMGRKQNDTRNIENHNKPHTQVRFHHMVTTSNGRKRQQTQITQTTVHSNWVHSIHQHTKYTRRNTHTTHKRTITTTRIPDKINITTPHTHTTLHYFTLHYITSQHNKQHSITSLHYRLKHNPTTINTTQNKHETHTHHHSPHISQQPKTYQGHKHR